MPLVNNGYVPNDQFLSTDRRIILHPTLSRLGQQTGIAAPPSLPVDTDDDDIDMLDLTE
jgi:hypothetical protein